jgi:hypothetical protein
MVLENPESMTAEGSGVYTELEQIPPDGLNDYFYRLEAFSGAGLLLKTYEPVFVPKVVVPLY